MPDYFYCCECGRRTRVNSRLKIKQKYCGDKRCQQSRKNSWEKEQQRKDPFYHQRRHEQKARWRKSRPAHEYQRSYRENHPDYVKVNREKQHLRDKNSQNPESGVCRSNIVKTDSLIVELRAHQRVQKVLAGDSG